ncbi:BnaC05g23710D [Brassica napus]|uniref:BnaC05g23710D protein n=1 Tax=Brassica napus TaxID=3708 RepID=A0A078FC45_BRANA|nr:BnaC05g23710D [Brassica napus]
MTSAVSPVANAVVAHSTFNSLRLGRTSQFVVGRLIRFWDSRNIKKNGEFMGITILLLDELDSVIHGFIPANRASHDRPDLKSGSIVKVDRFEVARCASTYKITEHQFVIRFTPSTRICEVLTDAPVINSERFMVRRYDHVPFQHIYIIIYTNLELKQNIYIKINENKNCAVAQIEI